jgi:signal transduction histidine kinase
LGRRWLAGADLRGNVTPGENRDHALAERVTRLQEFTAAFSSAVTMKDVAQVLFRRVDQLGANAVGIVWILRPEGFELVFGHGLTVEEFKILDDAVKAGARAPIRDAILSRRPVWLETPEEIRERYPILEPLRVRRGEGACAVIPLVVGAWCPGVVGFTFAKPRRFSADERSFLEALAQLSAQAFERARLFEAEQEARREAERAREMQEQLMAVVGHDLRTPLSAISASAVLMARRGELSPEQSVALGRISNSAARMTAMIADLLDFSRARLGLGVTVHRQAVDLAELARRTLLDFGEAEQERRLSLRIQGDARLEGDPSRLSQVISNLVGNALQYGVGHGARVEVAGGEEEVSLVVENEGPPIEAVLLPRLFEPFRRGAAHDPRGGRGGSLGLGLFIVREIVHAHGGRVDVRSEPGKGTAFTVRLPRTASLAGTPRPRRPRRRSG